MLPGPQGIHLFPPAHPQPSDLKKTCKRAAGLARGWWGQGESGGDGERVMGVARGVEWQEGGGGGKRVVGTARGQWRRQEGGRGWREGCGGWRKGGRAGESMVGMARGRWGR
ncbi:hypothetical protein K439DRAFT_1619966 [Ramaria rubella]|nr:hypothetical protein K439DRAFT_1619966 [Ramaria rubella]